MKNKFLILVLILLFPLIAFASQAAANSVKDIENNLENAAKAWNQGNIPAFMKAYKNSNSTIYVSSNMVRGYQNILANYLMKYSTKKKMGKLSFSDVEIKMLSHRYAIAIGKWLIVRSKNNKLGGIFTLVYEKSSRGWKIVIDHTS